MKTRQRLIWLVSLLVLLLLMISLGGVTRLTRSGLSITEGRPVTGVMPPLSERQWQYEFHLYKALPEFQQVNSHFQIDDYKKIFWWEYLHRVLGRIICFVAALLAFTFWRKKVFSGKYALLLPLTIALQELVSWLMVSTGLNHRTSVSHYMLSLHFFLAIVTILLVYFPIAKMKTPIPAMVSPTSRKLLYGLGVLLFIQIFYGCLTSGLKAGYFNNTFPLMAGQFFPAQSFALAPIFRNFIENPVIIQWIHRWLGVTTGIYLLATSIYLLKNESFVLARPLLHLISIVLIQVGIGVAVLVNQVPVSLGVIHQGMATLIVLGYFNIVFRLQAPPFTECSSVR